MPIYTFRCHFCGHRFDSLEKCGAKLSDCPDCGGECERAMHLHGMVQFHGKNGNKSAGAYSPLTKREQRTSGEVFGDEEDYPMREAKRVG